MTDARIRMEDGPSGLPIMKFTLTYEGELRANDDPRRKWEIRKQLHPQLKELWATNPTLVRVQRDRLIPKTGYWMIEGHHTLEAHIAARRPARALRPAGDDLDLCEEIAKAGRRFWPLVRDSFALTCALRVLFLRMEEPGRVYQGGDMDNRLKTLFDALAVPAHDNHVIEDVTIPDPIYCLLEDDRLITGFNIETHRLLSPHSESKHEVKLIIEVDVRVSQSRTYNQPFLGD